MMDTDPTTDDAVSVTETDANEIDPACRPMARFRVAGVRNSRRRGQQQKMWFFTVRS